MSRYQPNMDSKTLWVEDENLEELKEDGHTIIITAHGDEIHLERPDNQ